MNNFYSVKQNYFGKKNALLSQLIHATSFIILILALQVNSSAQLVTLDKAVDYGSRQSGQNITYTIEFGCSDLDNDCVGAMLVDTYPEFLQIDNIGPVIVESDGGNIPIFPQIDPVNRTISWDFTILPEGGIPAGFSAIFDIEATIEPGIVPDGATLSNSATLSSPGDTQTDNVDTDVSSSPKWTVTKTLTTSPIYHDTNEKYRIRVCPGSSPTIGNSHLINPVITDDLPPGAVFVSATNGGVHDGNTPGTVTWTPAADTLFVDGGCINYEVTVVFPSGDPNNDTGLDTPIPKPNTATLEGDDVNGDPFIQSSTINPPLNPPSFDLGITKNAADRHILPVGETNEFTINVRNNSTIGVNDFTVNDVLPPQLDLVRVQSSVRNPAASYDLYVQINGTGSYVLWQSGQSTSAAHSFEVSTIPGFTVGSDYVSEILWVYATVPAGFNNNLYAVVTPSFPNANDGSTTDYDAYTNNVSLNAINPVDNSALTPESASDYMCIEQTLARIDPAKGRSINYIDPPEGDETAGNPFFRNSRVQYNVTVENDGTDGTNADVTSAQAFVDLFDPIASDLLPPEVTYEPNSWQIIADNTGLGFDNSGVNPVFEQIDNFNGTGRTLLRWYFTGDFVPGEYVTITFNAIVNNDAPIGVSATNTLCITSTSQEFICDEVDCGETSTSSLNNYFGETGNPSNLITGVSEMCCKSSSFTVADSLAAPDPEKTLLTSGPFAPAGTSLVELGLATDTLEFQTTLANNVEANSTLPDPIGMDLLPEQLDYVPGSMQMVSNTTGLPLSDDGSNPVIQIIENYAGTNRTLIRWNYSGEFPINSKATFKFKTAIKPGAGGSFNNKLYVTTDGRNFDCFGSSEQDINDLDADGDMTELFCTEGTSNITIQIVTSLSSKKLVRGKCGTVDWVEQPEIASTFPGDSIIWRLILSNPGNTTLTNVSVVDIFPYIGDTGVRLNNADRQSGWEPYLVEQIVAPNGTNVFYSQSTNPCRDEMDPVLPTPGCINDWSLTPPADITTVKAVRITLDNDLLPGEEFIFDYKMMAPDGNFPIVGPVAWNSLARNSDQLSPQEPNKVGVGLCSYDLALKKVIQAGQPAEFEVGDDVIFEVKVFNQGGTNADEISIVDYLPVGTVLNDLSWQDLGGNMASKLLSTGNGLVPADGLAPGDSITVPIILTVNSYPQTGNTHENWAEISGFKEFGNPDEVTDGDSYPDDIFANDNFFFDNDISGNALLNQDEDDHDVAYIPMPEILYDWGDLPDGSLGTGTGNYQTTAADNGPSHLLGEDLFIGPTVDDEIDGQPSTNALGDGDDEDGATFPRMIIGQPYTIPVEVSNNTGSEATLVMFIDFEGDGDFDGPGETISLPVPDGFSGTLNMTGVVPLDAANGILTGVRFRLSTDEASVLIPTGAAPDGEVEDYLIILERFDLALRKQLITPEPYTYGDDLTFSIEVFNQGDVTATDVEVKDYIPSGYVYNSGSNPDWNGSAPEVTTLIAGPLAPGASTSVLIVLELTEANGIDEWDNYAEITAAKDDLGVDATSWDADSDPDSNAPHELDVQPGDLNDDEIDGQYIPDGEDEDDHDPAAPVVFDLALIKELTSVGPFQYNDLVEFTITLTNQGNVVAENIEVVDYVPSGFEYFAVDNPGWFGANPQPITNVPGPLMPGASTAITINLRLRDSSEEGAWINYAEIIASEDDAGNDMTNMDIDSPYDQVQNNDAGGNPNTGSDDTVLGDGTGAPLDTDPLTDEDDQDPALVDVFDLALRKTLLTAKPYAYGDNLAFQIEVFNQGNITATNVEVKDYIPAGFLFNGGDNPDWATISLAPIVATTIAGPIAPGSSETVTIVLELAQGLTPNAWDNYAEIAYAEDVFGNDASTWDADSNPDSNTPHETDVTPGDPNDDNIDGQYIPEGEDEDDHDPAGPDIFDLALTKVLSTPGPYSYGDLVDFTITVFNQGNTPAQNIEVSDYVPDGFEYDFTLNPGWSNFSTSIPMTTITSVLQPQTSYTLILRLIVRPSDQVDRYLNYAEISSTEDDQGNNMDGFDVDSTPDEVSDNDAGGAVNTASDDSVIGIGTGNYLDTDAFTDEDDHDPAIIEVFDLALRKSLLTSEPYTYGQDLTFEIEVFNQGTITATNVVVNDYIPDGYVFNGGDNPGWTGSAPEVNYTIVGPLAPGDSEVITIVLELAQGTDDQSWFNYAEIASAQNEAGTDISDWDADSNPDSNAGHEQDVDPGDPDDDNIDGTYNEDGTDEDDHDPAGPEIFDLALNKTTVMGGPFRIGDLVTFNVEVCNQGNITADEINVVDYVPAGFTYDYVSNFPIWNYDALSGSANAWINQPIAPGECTSLEIKLILSASPDDATGWTNRAEIFSTENNAGVDYSDRDIDSSPDSDPANDAGGLADSPADDYMDGNGEGVAGDGVAATDEDDADPERIEIFDLALSKILTTAGPHKLGDDLVFEIEVVNQGNITATDILVNDYVPDGYVYNPGDNPNWSGAAPLVTFNIEGPLAPGETETLMIILELDQGTGPLSWDNYAEIAAANDESGNDMSAWDADSNPNSDAPHERDVEPGDADDNNVDGHYVPDGTDEDDHDPAAPDVFDLALNKTTVNTGPFAVGDQVDFEIQVCNQGNMVADEIRIIDYVPSGFSYDFGANFPIWNFDPLSGYADTWITSPLAAGECVIIPLSLVVQHSAEAGDAWTNRAEIFSAEDGDGNNMTNADLDSTPDNDPENDAGDDPESPADDFLLGDGTGTPGDGVAATDEDDADPEMIEIFDLALQKTLITAAPYAYGDLLHFEITVFNQGNEPATSVEVTDYIPEGYSYDPLSNPSWVGVYPSPSYVIAGPIAPGESETISIYLTIEQTDGGEKDWINYSEITDAYNNEGEPRNTWDIDSDPATDGPGENAVEPGDGADDNIDSHDKGGEEDDHDPAGIEVFDLAQIKTTPNQEGPFYYGDVVTFTIEVFNQGSIEASGIEITDYIPCGFEYLAGNDANGWVYDANTGMAKVVLPVNLVPGASTTFTIDLLVQQCLDTDPNTFTNFAEISDYVSEDPDYPDPEDIDSMTDDDPTNDSGGTPDDPNEDDNVNGDKYQNQDEDDHDPERIEVFDLALKKELLTQPNPDFNYGDELEFSITVCNQGNVDAHNVVVTDYLPAGYVLSGNAANATWTAVGDDLEYTLQDPLLEDDCFTFSVFLLIGQTTGGEKDWINYTEITSSTDPAGDPRVDADSNEGSDGPGERAVEPGDPADDDMESTDKGGEEDDHDPAGIEVFDLGMYKTTSDVGPFHYGQDVTFAIKILNQGSIAAQNIDLIEYIPSGYTFDPVLNPQWNYDAGSGNATSTYASIIAPGDTATVEIVLGLTQAYEATAWDNYVEITGTEDEDGNNTTGDDFDSDPDDDPNNDNGGGPGTEDDDEVEEDGQNNPGDDEDDHDGERIEIFDLALKKVVDDRGPYSIGDTATFVLTVYNQGNIAATNIVVKDYLEPGFDWDGSLNLGWGYDGTDVRFTITNMLLPQDSLELTLKLVVGLSANPVPEDWYNWSEIESAADEDEVDRSADDADSTPDSDAVHERDVLPDDPDDNNVFGDYLNKGEDEDDHDPDKIIVVGGLGDFVWLDYDYDGVQDETETPVEGVVAILYDGNGVEISRDTTDTNGFYFFDNLIPGDYKVVMDGTTVPDGTWWTKQDEGNDDEIDSDVNFDGEMIYTYISGGEYDSTWDAGLVLLAELGDFVWHDLDGDGLQDAGEPGIEGAEVKLHDGSGEVIATTYTDANGYYIFEDLYPGDYYVEFLTPDGFSEVTFDNRGPDDAMDSDVNHENGFGTTPWVYLGPGESNLTIDAGYYICIPLGELVWCDYNFNDVWDPEENGINGLLVSLLKYDNGSWVLWDYTYTGHKPGTPSDDGYWTFCAPPGEYYIEIPIPPYGLVQAVPNVGNDELKDSDLVDDYGFGTTESFTVFSGGEKLDIGAGFYNMATMGDRVWLDDNVNGLQDPEESGVSGVIVKAFTVDNVQMGEVITNGEGQFNIEYLRKDAHYLKFEPPSQYGFTISDNGGDEMDSDVTNQNGYGTTSNYPLQPGEHVDLDAGLVLGALPIELTDFWGSNQFSYNYLEWETEREVNTELFTIERRFETEDDFTKIGEVKAAGLSLTANVYDLKDYNIEKDGVYYYKLQQINKDGKSTYSKVVAIVVDRSENTDIKLYPNPARDRFELELGLIQNNYVKVDILDAQGKLARVNLVDNELSTGFYKQVVDINNMAEGVYTVQIQIGDEIINKKLVIVK